MSEHIPKDYEWFGKNLHDSDEKVGYMDHILGCPMCRAKLEQSLENAWETAKNAGISPSELRDEVPLVKFMLWKNENTYRDIEEVVAEKLRR